MLLNFFLSTGFKPGVSPRSRPGTAHGGGSASSLFPARPNLYALAGPPGGGQSLCPAGGSTGGLGPNGLTGFRTAFVFSIETQATVGYGEYKIDGDCAAGVVLLSVQCIAGSMPSAPLVAPGCLLAAPIVGMAGPQYGTAAAEPVSISLSQTPEVVGLWHGGDVFSKGDKPSGLTPAVHTVPPVPRTPGSPLLHRPLQRFNCPLHFSMLVFLECIGV